MSAPRPVVLHLTHQEARVVDEALDKFLAWPGDTAADRTDDERARRVQRQIALASQEPPCVSP